MVVLLVGADMDELYVYNPEEHAWTFIRPRGKKPAPRYLHTAVVAADAMLVFGGTEQTAGDVWSFSFKKLAWTRLSHVCRHGRCCQTSQAVLHSDYHLLTVCWLSVCDISCCMFSKLMHYALKAVTIHVL